MKFGIALPNFGKHGNKETLLKLTLAAEEFGFDSVWVSNHIVIPKPPRPAHIDDFLGDSFYDAVVTLSYLAAETSRIRLGTSCLVAPYRHPLEIAKQFATLDVLSAGRVILGLAGGWLEPEFQALGIPFKERGKRLEESAQAVVAAWTQDDAEFTGRFYSFSGIRCEPKPVQKPHPPIWLGGNNERNMMRALKWANGWHPSSLEPFDLQGSVQKAKGLLATANNANFTISFRASLYLKEPQKSSWRASFHGKPEQVISNIREYESWGISYLVFDTLGGSVESVVSTLESFSKNVMPSFT